MFKKMLNQNGRISFIIILIIIIIILSIVLLRKINNPNKGENTPQYTYNDVYSWLDSIEQIDDISYDHYHSTSNGNVTHTKRYIKGPIMKMEYLDENGKLVQDIMIENLKDKTHIFYDESTGKGRKISIRSSKSKYVYVDFTYSFSELKDEIYKVSETSVNNIECIKAKGEENTIYFDKNTKLILKIEDTENPSINIRFENISVNTVTEDDVKVPKNISIEDKTK